MGAVKDFFTGIFSKAEKRQAFNLKDSPFFMGGATVSGVSVTSETAIGLTALWRAVDIVSSMLAVFPRKVYEKRPDGTRAEVYDHPVALLLSKMSESNETPFVFWYSMIARSMLFGGAAAKIYRDANGLPYKLQLLKGICTPFTAADGKRYLYATGETTALPWSDVVYIPGIMITDGEKGRSIVQTFADAFGEIKAAEMFSQMYFAKGGHLAGYVSFKEALTDIQLERRRESWNRNYGSIDAANGTAILDNDGRYVPINASMKDSEVTGSRTFGISEISRMTGVPVPMLGLTAQTSYNNIEGMNRHFYDLTILPWVTKTTQELDKKLLPFSNSLYIKTETRALLQADTLAQGQYFNMMLNNGTFSINEVRTILDMNPVEGGEKHRVQMQDVPIDEPLTQQQ